MAHFDVLPHSILLNVSKCNFTLDVVAFTAVAVLISHQPANVSLPAVVPCHPTLRYLIVNVPELETRDHSWMRDHLPNSVRLSNVTGHYATLALVGPKATELLGRLTHTSLQKADFSLSTAKVRTLAAGKHFLASMFSVSGWLRVHFVGACGN